ncbi:MAG TPA: Uma2 family endonuclease [Urbifossiella sp.]|nr:Uma2 family endonuclease [Urbifossiella sp.]
MSTAAPPLTPDDLLRMPDAGRGYELVNGELKEVEVSQESSRVGIKFAGRLDAFAEANRLGVVVGADAGFQCFPDDPGRVRRADAAFTSYTTVPRNRYQPDGFIRTAPDLVVEVVSPNDLADEVDEKRDEWLDAGVKVVWVAFPSTRTVQVSGSDRGIVRLRGSDTLTAPDLLPGFSVVVADLFRRPNDPAPTGPSPVQ